MLEFYTIVLQIIATLLMGIDYFSAKKYTEEYDRLFSIFLNDMEDKNIKYLQSSNLVVESNIHRMLKYFFLIYSIVSIYLLYFILFIAEYKIGYLSSVFLFISIIVATLLFFFLFMDKKVNYLSIKLHDIFFSIIVFFIKFFDKKGVIAGFGFTILMITFLLKLLEIVSVPILWIEFISSLILVIILSVIYEFNYKVSFYN